MRHAGSPQLLQSVLGETIPMYGRMIHGQDKRGNLTEDEQVYDVHGRYIRAVDRANLNKQLLNELQDLPNVKLNFQHKLTGADLKNRKAWFERTSKSSRSSDRAPEIEIDFDLILGADGAHSAVRFNLMKYVRMDYQQSYIDTLWCEFTIAPMSARLFKNTTPSSKDGFATSPNHLHIWPGEEDMFIAIPSKDQSFTCTLFAPSKSFAELEKEPTNIRSFFKKHFPGATELVGEAELQKQFQQNPHLPLINIKCTPHHFGSSAVILGDAAHAMVPFYGQGMNAGLEDVRVLFELLDANSSDTAGRATALEQYSKIRVPDAHTINDLAMANYWEMHAGVRSPLYLLRKNVEELLSDKLPATGFATQYSRVSFSNERYSEVRSAVSRQGVILLRGALASALPLFVGAAWLVWHSRQTRTGTLVDRLRLQPLIDSIYRAFRR